MLKGEQAEQIEQASEADLKLVEVLKLSEWELKYLQFYAKRFAEKLDNMQETDVQHMQRNKNSKDQKKVLENKNTETEMKNTTAEEIIHELEYTQQKHLKFQYRNRLF